MSQNGGPAPRSSLGVSNGGPPMATNPAANLGQHETARSVSVSAASPSPALAGLKQDPMARQSPATSNGGPLHATHAPNGVAMQGQAVASQVIPGAGMTAQPVQQQQLPGPSQNDLHRIPSHPPPKPLYDGKYRAPGRSKFT